MMSDSLKITIINREKLDNKDGYILPLSILSLVGKDKGIKSSENYRTGYVIVKGTYPNIDEANTPITGTVIAHTSWSVTASGSYSGKAVSRILDGNNATAWDSDGRLPAWIVLDMKTSSAIKGFAIVPSYEYRDENFLTMEVLSSNDGTNWKSQGEYNGTATLGSSTTTNPDIKNVKFLGI